ncbi:GMC family oxidoreductase [Nocardia rhamnosiphila]
MASDASGARRDAPAVADVLIIGAGAGGAVAARELGRHGISVVCLEQGRWYQPADYVGDKPQLELQRLKQWCPDPNVRRAYGDYPVATDSSDFDALMFNAVGGTTILYSGHWCRMLPSDFRVRSLDGIADDWPISYDELRPFYDEVARDVGVSGLAGDPAYPDEHSFPLPPLPIGRYGRRAAQGMDALGWHWWPAPNAIASRSYRGRDACQRYGSCEQGCPAGAKGSTDLTHWRHAIDDGVVLITQARVSRLTTNAAGLVTGAEYADAEGKPRHQRAQTVIVAANAVGTPRLLLNSASGAMPDGVANSSGLVGKRLMMHPYGSVIGTYDEELESWLGPLGQSLQSMQFYETDTGRGFARGAKWHLQPTGGPLARHLWQPGTPWTDLYGPNFHRITERFSGCSAEWGIVCEDLPRESNSVTLDGELTDSDGIPAPRVTYRVDENTRAMLAFHTARAVEAHEAAGATSTTVAGLGRDSGWHMSGTARMGNNPAESVVDQHCRTHDIPNLYLMDGSVFVTSSGVNPTATIMAVALRAARRMATIKADQKVPL